MSQLPNGSAVLVYVETTPPGNYDLIASQRDFSITETNELIDESSKDAREYKGSHGRYTATMSLTALYVPSDTAYQKLRDECRAGNPVLIQYSEDGTDVENISALITSLGRAMPDQEESLVTAELQATGAWAAAT